ncbi:MAG: hypothetical protein J0L66_11150 [Cytophagales bacterium]|nr:hypothetical protein [Cytophagales bacterium]
MRIACLLVFIVFAVEARQPNFWHVLAEVGFKKTKVNNQEVEVPVFSNHLKSYHGNEISLKGYIIPVSETGAESKFMLSSLPLNVCYFCGAAGPETIVEVATNQKIKFTSQAIWMQGILVLNDKDPDHHIYILKSARIISEP